MTAIFGDLLNLDFAPDAFEFDPTLLLDLAGEEGAEMVLDTLTGELVDASTLDPSEIGDPGDADYDFGPMPVEETANSTSTSDTLRSRDVDPNTYGTEDFDRDLMADPSASIASTGSSNSPWLKSLAQGLGDLLKAGGGLSALGRGGAAEADGKGLGLPPGVGLMTPPGAIAVGSPGLAGSLASAMRAAEGGAGFPGGGNGLASLGLTAAPRYGPQDAIAAALGRLQAEPDPRLPPQRPLDVGPVPYSPITLPARAEGRLPGPTMGGLQRLALERLG